MARKREVEQEDRQSVEGDEHGHGPWNGERWIAPMRPLLLCPVRQIERTLFDG